LFIKIGGFIGAQSRIGAIGTSLLQETIFGCSKIKTLTSFACIARGKELGLASLRLVAAKGVHVCFLTKPEVNRHYKSILLTSAIV
jgi:hypothetical protein